MSPTPSKNSPVFIFFLLQIFLITTVYSQEKSFREVFGEKDDLIRTFENKSYKFYDRTGALILNLQGFTYASDFNEGVAVVKGNSRNSYGAINKQGMLILDTIWTDTKPSSAGYLLTAKEVDGFIMEDRGQGNMKYPKVKWYFVQGNTGNILDELEFKVILNVNGLVSAIDYEGNTYLIDVHKINPGLFDPFMKAVLEINERTVFSVIDKVFGTIAYKYHDTGKNALSHAYNKDPFSKYDFTWKGQVAMLHQD